MLGRGLSPARHLCFPTNMMSGFWLRQNHTKPLDVLHFCTNFNSRGVTLFSFRDIYGIYKDSISLTYIGIAIIIHVKVLHKNGIGGQLLPL